MCWLGYVWWLLIKINHLDPPDRWGRYPLAQKRNFSEILIWRVTVTTDFSEFCWNHVFLVFSRSCMLCRGRTGSGHTQNTFGTLFGIILTPTSRPLGPAGAWQTFFTDPCKNHAKPMVLDDFRIFLYGIWGYGSNWGAPPGESIQKKYVLK